MSAHAEGEETPRRLGLVLFLVSVAVMFIASLIAYGATRASQDHWVSIGIPGGLWGSSALALGITVVMRRARDDVARNELQRARRHLHLTVGLAAAFLAAQALNWLVVHTDEVVSHSLYAATFYMLTGLHALHVLGGVVPLVVTTVRAGRGEYSSSRMEALRLLTLYWDFLAAVWVVLFAALWLGS